MNLLATIEFTAVVASAIYGILRANNKGLDFVGVFSIASAVAFGGGTMRDLFLDRHPLFWIKEAHYPLIVFGLAAVGALLPRMVGRLERFFVIPDAIGLGFFSIVGTAYAQQSGTSAFIAVLMGVVTGTFGGVIADIICNEIPHLFRSTPLYATCSFVGGWVFVLMQNLALSFVVIASVGIGVTMVMRLVAVYFNVQLPVAASPDVDQG